MGGMPASDQQQLVAAFHALQDQAKPSDWEGNGRAGSFGGAGSSPNSALTYPLLMQHVLRQYGQLDSHQSMPLSQGSYPIGPTGLLGGLER